VMYSGSSVAIAARSVVLWSRTAIATFGFAAYGKDRRAARTCARERPRPGRTRARRPTSLRLLLRVLFLPALALLARLRRRPLPYRRLAGRVLLRSRLRPRRRARWLRRTCLRCCSLRRLRPLRTRLGRTGRALRRTLRGGALGRGSRRRRL